MGLLKKYKFTVKKNSLKGIMGVLLGLIGIGTFAATVFLGYLRRAQVPLQYGAAMALAEIMSLAGFIISIVARLEKDRYYLFPNIGIVLNFLVLAAGGYLLFLGK